MQLSMRMTSRYRTSYLTAQHGVEITRWLGAGAVTFGVGVALITGAGVAHAEKNGPDGSASIVREEKEPLAESSVELAKSGTTDEDVPNSSGSEPSEPVAVAAPTAMGTTETTPEPVVPTPIPTPRHRAGRRELKLQSGHSGNR